MPLRVFIAGQRSFGAAVYRAVQIAGHDVVGVACPNTKHYDPLKKAAYCTSPRPVIIDAGCLHASDIPDRTAVLIAAHSHHFISRQVRDRVAWAIGYHPSMLPRHRGRDAVRWTIKFNDPIAGGTVYVLTDKVDRGPIVRQRAVMVGRAWAPRDLWRRLFSLGIELLIGALTDIEAGTARLVDQDEAAATWEPPIGRTRIHRPDLPCLGPA